MGKSKAGKTTKTFQAEILCKEFPRLKNYLWITHRIFNESIPFVIRYMRWMEKGKKGPLVRRFNPETAEKFKAVYHDMMGLPYKGIVELSGVDKKNLPMHLTDLTTICGVKLMHNSYYILYVGQSSA